MSDAFKRLEHFANQTGTTTEHPESLCNGCGETLNGSDGMPGETPRPGDVSVCGYCGALYSFTATLALAPMTRADIDALPAADRATILEQQSLTRALRAAHFGRPSPKGTA